MNEYTLNNIPLGEDIVWTVRAVCLIGGITNWNLPAQVFTFDYNPPCADVGSGDFNLTVDLAVNGFAVVSWDDIGGAIDYEVNIDGVYVSTGGDTEWVFTGLTEGSTYTVNVRSVCLIGGTSDPASITFEYYEPVIALVIGDPEMGVDDEGSLKPVSGDGRFDSEVGTYTSVDIVAYPNPTTLGQQVHLQVKGQDRIEEVFIVDIRGALVGKIQQSAATQKVSFVPVNYNMATGLYILRIRLESGEIETVKLVIQ